jgi:magnesium transporter
VLKKEKVEIMTIICKSIDLSNHQTEVIEQPQVASYLKQEQTLLWIEMKLPSDGELDWLGQTFALHQSTVKLIQLKGDYPAFDWQEAYYIFAGTAVRIEEQQVMHDPAYLIASQKYFITIEYHPVGVLDNVRKQWDSHQSLEHAALYFIFLILDSIVVSYFEAVRAIRLQIDELHNTSLERGQTDVAQHINRLLKHSNDLEQMMFNSMFSGFAFLHKEEGHSLYPITASRIYFRQLNEHYKRTEELIQRNKEMLTILLHQFQSRQADYLNTLVNRLTVVTIILSTAAVITGFYGINVGGLYPNESNANGAWIVLVIIVLLAIIQFLLLRPLWRRKS